MSDLADLFRGFDTRRVKTSDGELFVRIGGSGPPLVLLHGFPQNHACWHKITSELAAHFKVIIPDLRGYGQSSIPASNERHEPYSKRVMGRDIFELMTALGHGSFALAGHDRGGRVAYRMALDEPDRIEKLALLDIVTTCDMWREFDFAMSMQTYHWPFLAQPFPLPETLIESSAIYYLEYTLASWTQSGDLAAFDENALALYRAAFCVKERLHAFCEDYRAGASRDMEADEADRDARRKIICPTHVLWGTAGIAKETTGPLDTWLNWCESVSGTAIDAGHFLAEENPQDTIKALLPFLLLE